LCRESCAAQSTSGQWRLGKRDRSQLEPLPGRCPLEHSRIDRWYYVRGKTLHLFKLRTALQQEKVNANRFKLGNAFRNLAGCADQSRSQSPITDGVIFERNMLVKLCAGQPLLIIVVAGGGLLHVGNACQFFL